MRQDPVCLGCLCRSEQWDRGWVFVTTTTHVPVTHRGWQFVTCQSLALNATVYSLKMETEKTVVQSSATSTQTAVCFMLLTPLIVKFLLESHCRHKASKGYLRFRSNFQTWIDKFNFFCIAQAMSQRASQLLTSTFSILLNKQKYVLVEFHNKRTPCSTGQSLTKLKNNHQIPSDFPP